MAKRIKEEKIRVEIQEQYAPLLSMPEVRYKLYYGGRAGGKSYGFADALLVLARQGKLLIACVREVQNSIKDSVYKLLKDRAEYWGFEDYRFYEDRIENILTGSRFIFKGLQDNNAQNIKSLEGVDICWIEEGQSISKKSWEILDPTIRKPGAQIWISMNRELENDPIWVALARNPHEDVYIQKVNYTDNLYCPPEMKKIAERMKAENYEQWLHVWAGEPVQEGDTKLIGYPEVYRALETKIENSATVDLPLIIGVDIARFGNDKTAVARRVGRKAYKIQTYAKLDVVQVANMIVGIIHDEHPAIVNIDVGGLGGGVYDILWHQGYGSVVQGVNFGERAQESERYCNRRSEMWARLKDWLTAELPVSLVDCEGLSEDLTAPNKNFDSLGRLVLEPKDDIKKRLGRSTDVGDALALTFAERFYPSSLLHLQYDEAEFVDDSVYTG